MSLDSVFVDRARIVSQAATSAGRVRGMTRMAQTEGAWFGAFLQLPQANASPDSSQGRRRVVTAPTLMFDVVDENDQPVVVNASVRVEVESDRFGTSLWETTADPAPIANLSDVLGYEVLLRRVTAAEFVPVGG